MSELKLIDDKEIKFPLYFQPPITTNNSRKMITPMIEPTDMKLKKPFLLDCGFFCSVTFNIITTKRNKTATAPT